MNVSFLMPMQVYIMVDGIRLETMCIGKEHQGKFINLHVSYLLSFW